MITPAQRELIHDLVRKTQEHLKNGSRPSPDCPLKEYHGCEGEEGQTYLGGGSPIGKLTGLWRCKGCGYYNSQKPASVLDRERASLDMVINI